jgi:hypothetical protein
MADKKPWEEYGTQEGPWTQYAEPVEAKKPSKERTYGEAVTDIGAGLIGGVGSLVQLPGQLYGLATGNFNKTGALGAGEQISQYAEEMKSAGLKAREAERAQKIAESAQKGQFAAAGTAFAETVKDPALLLSFLAQQAPQLLIPFGAARGVGMAAKGLGATEAAAGKAAVSGAVGAGATQQGADVGAGAYENIYNELLSKGASPKEAAEGSLNLAGQAGAAAGTLSLLVQRLPGARQLEEALAGVPGKGAAGLAGRLKTAGGTALGETISEVPEEVGGKFAQNVAMRQVKPEQSLTEGLGEAGGMAAIGAIGLGGATGLSRTPAATPPPSQFNPENLSSDIVKQIESIIGIKPEQARPEMLSPEEAAQQRVNLLQKKVDADEQAQIEKAAREGIPPQVPEIPTPDTSKPSLAEQVPAATPRETLEAKQAQIDQLRLDAGLPTGASSKTPGVQPADVTVTDTPVPKIVDTRALDERAAQNRLLVMQNMLKNQGGDPDSLAIIPHPQVEGKFAIQSLDVPVKFTKNLPETAINRPETPKIIDPIEAYIEVARRTNTPASMRLIRDYEAGIVTKEDIQAAVDAERKANQPLPINYKGNGEPWFVAPDKYRIKGDRGERYVPLFDESKIAEEPFRPPPPKTKNELPKTLGEYKLRMPRAYDNPTYREANKQSNFKMLADAMSTSPNPIYKRIGELSQKIADKVTLHKPGALEKRKWLGQYDPNDNSIKMRPSHAGDEWTNVHESVHALTVYAQRNPTPAQKPYVDQINNLFEHVTKELKKKGYSKKNIYGLTDPLEFTAEAMSNVEFQYMLMQIPYPGKKSTWTKFVELVADLLGITDTNALTEVMNLVDKLGQKAGGRNRTITPMTVMGSEDFSVPAKPSGQSAIDIVEGMGRTLEKPTQSMLSKARESWDNALDNPKATAEAASTAVQRFNDRIQTLTFSSDAALNNKIRRMIMDSNLESKEKIGTLLNISLSQTVHADALSNLLMTEGNLKYNNDLHKWEAVKDKANFVELSKGLDKLAENHGLNKEKADRIAHTAFEARRLKSMVAFNEKVDREVADMRAEAKKLRDKGSAVAANALSEKADRRAKETKFIHMTPQQIADGVSLFKLMPELDGISKVWNDMRENTVQILVDTGLWSREEAEFMLENVDYVPFFREEQIEEGKGPKEYIRGLMVQAKEKRLKGSEKPVNDVFDNMARWMQYSVNRAVRNRSALALIDTAVDAGLAKKIEKRTEGTNPVRVWRDGKEEFYDMTDPMFVDAFTGLESVAIPTWKWMTKMSDMLRQSVVMYPLFSVAQLPQDSFAAMFTSGLKAQYALSIPARAVKEFLKTLAGTSETNKELKKFGVVGVRDFTSAMARIDAEVYAGLKASPGLKGKIKDLLTHVAMASDNAVRQATYEAAMAQGLSRGEAIEKAFEIWNVRRKGTSKSLAFAGQVIPFFNAYLAAQNVALKTISGTGVSPTERSEAIKTLLGTTASVMVLSLLYAMMNGDDEDYINKPAVVRDRLLMIPGTGMSIPLRADLFSIPKIVTEHMYLLMTDKGYEDGRKFRDSMSAVLKSALFSPTVVPQAFKPWVEIGINYDFYSGRPLIGHFEKMKETERQFTDTTSELAKLLGSTGIMSPIAIDHIVRGMFGSVGGLVVYMTNPLLHSDPNVDRPTMSAKDMMAALPGTSGFVSRDYESGLKNDFYVLRDEVAKVTNTMSDLKQRSPEKITEYLSSDEIITRYGMAKGIQKITDQLGNIRKNISRVTNAPRDVMSADEKAEQIKQLRSAERDMLKAINTKQLRSTAKL